MSDAWHTVLSVWGFSDVLSVDADISDFMKALNAAESRGIKAHLPSDALDLSRDLMIDEAAHQLGADWSIAQPRSAWRSAVSPSTGTTFPTLARRPRRPNG